MIRMRKACPTGYKMSYQGVCQNISTGGDIDTPFEHGYNWWQDVFHKSEWQQKDWMFRRGGRPKRRRR